MEKSEIIIKIWENIVEYMSKELYFNSFSSIAMNGTIKHHRLHDLSLSNNSISITLYCDTCKEQLGYFVIKTDKELEEIKNG